MSHRLSMQTPLSSRLKPVPIPMSPNCDINHNKDRFSVASARGHQSDTASILSPTGSTVSSLLSIPVFPNYSRWEHTAGGSAIHWNVFCLGATLTRAQWRGQQWPMWVWVAVSTVTRTQSQVSTWHPLNISLITRCTTGKNIFCDSFYIHLSLFFLLPFVCAIKNLHIDYQKKFDTPWGINVISKQLKLNMRWHFPIWYSKVMHNTENTFEKQQTKQ